MKSFNLGDLKVKIPVIQGGMGIGISLSGLASAVANMGGIGVISSVGIGLAKDEEGKSYRKNNIDALRNEIRQAKGMTDGVLGVNIMSVLSDFAEMVKTSIEEKIDVIFSGAGLPLNLPEFLTKDSVTKLVPIVSSGRAAEIISYKWKHKYDYIPDAFVVEGPLAGGHLGFKADGLLNAANTLEEILEEVLNVSRGLWDKYKVKVPVIAAGGLYSGKDILNIMERGASGVQLGTRFVATEECDASENFKNAFVEAKEDNIQIIKSPVGLPGRTIFNNFLKEAYEGKKRPASCNYRCIKTCNPKTTLYCIANALQSAYKGNMENGFAFAGSNVGLVDKITTVKKVFEDLKNEYFQAKRINKG